MQLELLFPGSLFCGSFGFNPKSFKNFRCYFIKRQNGVNRAGLDCGGGHSEDHRGLFVLGVVEHVAIAIDWGPFKSDYKEAIALVLLLLILVVRSRKLSEEERVS